MFYKVLHEILIPAVNTGTPCWSKFSSRIRIPSSVFLVLKPQASYLPLTAVNFGERRRRRKIETLWLAPSHCFAWLPHTHTQKYGRQIGPTHQQHFIQKTVQRGGKPFALHYSRCNREALIQPSCHTYCHLSLNSCQL